MTQTTEGADDPKRNIDKLIATDPAVDRRDRVAAAIRHVMEKEQEVLKLLADR